MPSVTGALVHCSPRCFLNVTMKSPPPANFPFKSACTVRSLCALLTAVFLKRKHEIPQRHGHADAHHCRAQVSAGAPEERVVSERLRGLLSIKTRLTAIMAATWAQTTGAFLSWALQSRFHWLHVPLRRSTTLNMTEVGRRPW